MPMKLPVNKETQPKIEFKDEKGGKGSASKLTARHNISLGGSKLTPKKEISGLSTPMAKTKTQKIRDPKPKPERS